MATYVLVHGAWHGGWCWGPVRTLLRNHQVFAPSLTGLGERKHLARPDIDLDTHIEDIVSLLEMEDLRDVVLVGHSYGGMVITGVADRAADRIGLVIAGDLATCVRVLERERLNATGEVNRIIELVWASVTEEVLGVRSRIERWPISTPDRRHDRVTRAPRSS